MTLERTPLLLEARRKQRQTLNRAADLERSRTHKKPKHHKKTLIQRLRDGTSKLPPSNSAITPGMTVPIFGMVARGAAGPVGVGGIMRHS